MTTILHVNNLKCEGCANAIKRALDGVDGAGNIQVHVGEAIVSFDHEHPDTAITVKETIARLGYPQSGSVKGIAQEKQTGK